MARKRRGLPPELTREEQQSALAQIMQKYKIERGPTRILRPAKNPHLDPHVEQRSEPE